MYVLLNFAFVRRLALLSDLFAAFFCFGVCTAFVRLLYGFVRLSVLASGFLYGSIRPLLALAFCGYKWILTLTWTKKNLILLVYKRRDVNGKEQKNHHLVVCLTL